ARILEAGRLPGLYHAPFLELTYALSRRTEGGLEYRFQHFTLGGELAQAHSLANRLRYRLSRQTTLSARAGPALYWDERGGRGVVARAGLDLAHEGRRAELYFSAGQELVGASGFTAALWAQYAAVAVSARPAGALRPYASASYFRNGRAPDVGIDPLGDWSRVTQGYAVGAGLEWRLSKHLALAATADRYSQLGEVPAAGDLSRNIVAVRAVLSPW
ncbi:MAG: hypothetical protein HYZ28_26310, partial [Myxococcales bacterium]|nr:hypothetical protein [Myxococcales bacterium]